MSKITRTAFFVVLALLVSFNSFSKDKVKEPSSILTLDDAGNYEYTKVFEVPGKSKEEIYTALKTWIVENIKSQSNTNYFDDDNHNKMSTAPFFLISHNNKIGFKLNIDVKDGKYRLSATSFIFVNVNGVQKSLGDYSGFMASKRFRMKTIEEVDNNFKGIISSIESSAKTDSKKKDDW